MAIHNKSHWLESQSAILFPKVEKELHTEVLIIGGGITGLTSAYLLAKEGKKVILAEKNKVGEGESAYSTGFLSQLPEAKLKELEDNYTQEEIDLILQSHRDGVELIVKIANEEKIHCDLEKVDNLLYSATLEQFDDLKQEVEFAQKFGLEVEYQEKQFATLANFNYLRLPEQYKFNIVKYLDGLKLACKRLGVEIYQETKITSVEKSECGCDFIAKTEAEHTITAKYLIEATHFPFSFNLLQGDFVRPTTTYVMEVSVPKGQLPYGIYWDMDSPYYYFRIDAKNDLYDSLVLGGGDHRTGYTPEKDPHLKLKKYLKDVLRINHFEINYKWYGMIYDSIDSLPFIGELRKNHLVATGFSGNGLTLSGLSAQLFTQIILDQPNPYKELYKIHRDIGLVNLIKSGATNGLNLAFKWLKSFFNTKETLPNGEGKVINLDNTPTAIYKDPEGKITKFSAKCTHQGCLVEWNGLDKTWDCPCHGSKFSKEGKVLIGPATKDLPTIE